MSNSCITSDLEEREGMITSDLEERERMITSDLEEREGMRSKGWSLVQTIVC